MKKSLALPIFICVLAAMFYLYDFVLQVSPGIMTNELMRDLHLDAAGLGAMAAFYYYAYTPMQLPAGLLYDRFGPRRLITIAILICAAGAFFFGHAHTTTFAATGRFLMGVGSAFSFIGALLLVSRWFPPQHFALIAGIVQLMSAIGAITGEAPLAAAVAQWGWRHTIIWTAFFGVFLAILVSLIVRDGPSDLLYKNKKTENNQGELSRLRQVCINRETWLTAIYSFAIWAPIVAFALWGVPFLVAAYGLSIQMASMACSMMWLGIGIGSPLLGWWSDYISRRCMPLSLCGVLGVISIALVIYLPEMSLPWLFVLLFVFGMASAGQSLAFGVVKDNNCPTQAGTAIGFNNMATVAGGALFQPLIGILLRAHSTGTMHGGVPVYSTSDYHWALLALPLCYLLSAVISAWFMRETHCQHQY